MKYNQKGFTLIELLAVIVILAIIALITTPAILNVVNDSRKKAAIDSTFGVIDGVKYAYTQNQLEASPVTTDPTVDFSKGYNDAGRKIGSQNINISGSVPESGTVTVNITNGIISASKLKFGQFYCSTYTEKASNDAVCCVTNDIKCESDKWE